MLQRIQSVWLLLAAAFNATTFRFPFFTGDWNRDQVQEVVDLNAQSTNILTILTVLTGILAFITIFLYHKRKLQLKLTYLGMFLSGVLLVLYFMEAQNFSKGSIALWVIFYFAILCCFILASRGIVKDERLIKSMDRLR